MFKAWARFILRCDLAELEFDLELRKAWSAHWFDHSRWLNKKLEITETALTSAEAALAQYEAKRTCKHCGKVFNEPPAMYHHVSKGRCPKLKDKPIPFVGRVGDLPLGWSSDVSQVPEELKPWAFGFTKERFGWALVRKSGEWMQVGINSKDVCSVDTYECYFRGNGAAYLEREGFDLAPTYQKEHELPMQGLG